MADPRQMKLGLSLRYLGYHMAAWRHPDVPADGAIRFDYFLESARKAEAARFDMIFFADGIGVRADDKPEGSLCRDMKNAELEPLTLLAALGACTSHVGLVATASTTYNEPFHIARKFASIDHISGGRAGWNVVTSWSEQEAWNFSRDAHLGYEERYERAAEFVEVVTRLWDSWEPDAFVRDKASGLFYDPKKLHVPHHAGKHFKVRGPLNSARTPQGRPVIIQAGASAQGREIAARHADVIYSAPHTLDAAKAFYADIKGRLVRQGRRPGDLLILPGITTYVGRTEAEAAEKLATLQRLIHPLTGLATLHNHMGDLRDYDLDGPVPPPVNPSMRSMAADLFKVAQAEKLTIRQLYERAAAGNGGRILVGTPGQIADDMERWIDEGAADGFNLCPATVPPGVDDFIELVLPELRRRGRFREAYEGTTLRQNLGLPPLD